MARHLFCDTPADFIIAAGDPASGGKLAVLRGDMPVTFWNADTAGTQYVDLLNAAGAAVTSVNSVNTGGDYGYIPKLSGPDNVWVMWADANGGFGPRFKIVATDADLTLSKAVLTDTAQTIADVKTFTALPTIPATPIANTDAASKGYIDGRTLFARKTADTARSSTTTLANDPHLVVAVVANATYVVTVRIGFNASITGDLKNAFALPAGATSRMFVTATALGYLVDNTATDIWNVSATNTYAVGYNGLLIVGGTAGNFAFQWAQNVSDAGATNVLTNSFMTLQRVA